MKDYLRCIKSIDDEVGRLVEYLKEHNLMENTVIVYTSDQGFYMGEHGWFDKRFMYEESLRTPLIIYYPGMKKGKKCSKLVQNIDYAPTILDIAGIDKPDYMSGESLIPLLKGNTPKNWRRIFIIIIMIIRLNTKYVDMMEYVTSVINWFIFTMQRTKRMIVMSYMIC